MRHCAAETDDLVDRCAEGAVADDGVGAGDGEIEDGRAIGIDAEIAQVAGDKAGGCFGGGAGTVAVACFVAGGVRGGGGQRAAEWRAEALHAAAFLVDEDKRFVSTDGFARVRDEAADLVVGLAIAGEQDDAERARCGEEALFRVRQAQSF
jgi:hypothetical protein